MTSNKASVVSLRVRLHISFKNEKKLLKHKIVLET